MKTIRHIRKERRKAENPFSLESVLYKFTLPSVPKRGREEENIDPPTWRVSTQAPSDPAYRDGIARYPMLYIGEGCNRIFLVNGGKVIWTYDTGTGWELDDIWMKKSGNILFTRMSWAGEVTPDKRLVWRRSCLDNEEYHTIQPIDAERVAMAVNAPKPYCMIVNTRTDEVEYRHEIPYENPGWVHGHFRRFRMTDRRTFLVPYLSLNQVIEYDMDFNVLWRYAIDQPWAAVRLKNGNTLINDEYHGLVREAAQDGRTVWELSLAELPQEARLSDCQSSVRLSNGNTILCSRGNGGLSPQMVEVTPDKRVVWCLNDWRELGPCTAVQILSDPGDPEIPGNLQR